MVDYSKNPLTLESLGLNTGDIRRIVFNYNRQNVPKSPEETLQFFADKVVAGAFEIESFEVFIAKAFTSTASLQVKYKFIASMTYNTLKSVFPKLLVPCPEKRKLISFDSFPYCLRCGHLSRDFVGYDRVVPVCDACIYGKELFVEDHRGEYLLAFICNNFLSQFHPDIVYEIMREIKKHVDILESAESAANA